MTTHAIHATQRSAAKGRAGALLVGLLAVFASASSPAVDLAQRPLFLGPSVPGNLILVPSVEFPTVISVANIGNYATATRWVGYFDSSKCYGYQYSAVESERHFYPVGPAAGATCNTSTGRWSGNFLNWAATQTIDPFRSALTGGNRVRDTPSETFLQKGRMDRDNTANFPRRTIGGALVTGATPATWGNFNMRIDGLGQRMWFTGNGNVGIDRNNAGTVAANVVAYDPAVHVLNGDQFATPTPVRPNPLVPRSNENVVYEVSVRVKVCDPAAGLEPNCVRYSGGYKPEGLIQEYSNRVRYAMLGYLNDSSDRRDGGVLRANIKYVGPMSNDPVAGPLANAAREWDGDTGVLIRNPNPADAALTNARLGITTIVDSGIINYLNKFGEVSNTRLMKSIDPVSELYYAALRYVKNQGDVQAYSNITDATLAGRYETADGFPVLRNWEDPLQYSCQANVLLGIGDTNTHVDKNLPGPTNMTREPVRPAEVLADTTVDVVALFERIRAIEPGLPAANAQSFSGRDNSAYIASLAYHANTQDIRLDQPGRQSAQTYWVDVLEFQNLAGRTQNQYWLATKYGGFKVPSGFNPITNAAPIPAALWNSSGENLAAGYPRPDNFFPARDAANMVISLRRAFQSIVAQVEGSGVSFATNTTRLEADARVYQASFFSGTWRGDLDAFSVNPTTGQLSPTAVWSASTALPAWASRNIWVNSGTFQRMNNWAGLTAAHRTALGTEQVMNFLRGNRSDEIPNGAQLRTRQSPLGTFVNSQPVFVGKPNPSFYAGKGFTGAASYPAFAAAQASRTPIVYIGSNGGLFHGFNANNGVEVFAFMPKSSITAGVATLASPAYEHRYLVDGDAAVADVYDTSTSSWRTVLVASMGRGAKGVFALDVTNPANVQFLWEKTDADIPQLGNVLTRPVIAQIANGDWRVFLGNGVNGDGNANLITIELVGANAGAASVTAAASGPDNGMSGVLVWDEDNDAIGDLVYATDALGNVWKFDNIGSTPTVLRLFSARSPSNDVQPISAAPLVGRNPGDGKVWVFFGTGRYLGNADLSDDSVQTWYGLKDEDATISGRGELLEVDIDDEGTIGSRPVRVIEDISPGDLVGESGWYIDLISPVNGQQGERIIEPNQFQGLTLLAASRIPSSTNICAPGGTGYVMAINPFTGGRLATSFFDIDGNSSIGASDMLGGVPVSGIGFSSAPNNPTFLGPVMQVSLDDRSRETVVTSSGALQPRRVSWREVVNE